MKSCLCSCAASLVVAALTSLAMSGTLEFPLADETVAQQTPAPTTVSQPANSIAQSETTPVVKQADSQSPTTTASVIKHVEHKVPESKQAGNVPATIQTPEHSLRTCSTTEVRGKPEVHHAVAVPVAAETVPFSRRNPVVEAVAKTKAGVVSIRVARQGEKDMIGTGFIVDESGLIVTNLHVTGGKPFVKVRLHDGTDIWGKVIITEKNWDLAIVRIDTNPQQKLQALTLAPTTDLMLAETVIAIGNPYGYEGTVSVGNISALNREITMPNDVTITGLIQTTAPINPGNSGGPLVNINGEVIGVNVALRDGAQNIAFAINAGTVKNFLHQHFNAKRVSGIDHGMKYEEKVLAEVGDRQRVVVQNTVNGELKNGDIILTVGTKKVVSAFDMERVLWHKKPGEQVAVKVSRQGREMTVTMTLVANQGAGSVAAETTGTPVNNPVATSDVRSANQR